MKAFIDTSSLIKRYVQESGSDAFEKFLETISEILIAPTTWLEIHSVLERRLREKTMSKADAELIELNAYADLQYMGIIKWNEELEKTAAALIRKYQLKVMDSIQLASGKLSKSDLFVTSDKQLYAHARKELKRVEYIG